MEKELEARLRSLELRLTTLEGGKKSAEPPKGKSVLSTVGLAYLLQHLNDKITGNPQFGGYDDHLKAIFSVEITPENRLEYAEKARKPGLSLLDDAVKSYGKNAPLKP